ncbi:GIY-YIG nuclease family protein [Tunturiibacter gelidoferens]|uniref:GIY-YIG nuclease family protein n=1 Tax=Tunturiibacter gelidiferens TaxID=3069689 RepID=UPI0021B11986|nr:GIY-YIG nuclease family protein [Edaphobacter lichenicola]
MPPREYHVWVYILSSRSQNLYIGSTNSIHRRTNQHREASPKTHTAHTTTFIASSTVNTFAMSAAPSLAKKSSNTGQEHKRSN